MNRFAAAVFAMSVVACLSSPAQAQKLGQTIDVSGWKVSMDKAKDGSTYCMALYTYDDKSAIGFMADNDDNHMFLVSEPTAKMTENEQMTVSYRIDKRKAMTGVGVAASATMLVVPMTGDTDALYDAFRKGNSMFITLGKEEFEEPLTGSDDAIGGLGDCTRTLPARGKKK